MLDLGERHGLPLETLLSATSLDDQETRLAMRKLQALAYLADPHTALAWQALVQDLGRDEEGAFLCTAHPAKFIEVLEQTLEIELPLPDELEAVRDKEVLSTTIQINLKLTRYVIF